MWTVVAQLTGCTAGFLEDSEPPALHSSAEDGDLEGVRMLIEEGQSVDLRGRNGQTPLMAAAGMDNSTTQALLDYGADVNLRDDDGWSAVMLAYYRIDADPEGVRLLMNAGADQSVPDSVEEFQAATLCEQARLDDKPAMVDVLC